MPEKILVVDDDVDTLKLVGLILQRQGYEVHVANSGSQAIASLESITPDLILLDIMMPEMDGFQFLSQFRKESTTPVIIITAKDEETDAVLGLELGADDFIVKPFRMRELVARIRAVFRRIDQQEPIEKMLRIGDIMLDAGAHVVAVNEEPVDLTPTEFNLLTILMSAPGRVFKREALVDRLVDEGFTGLDRAINVHIRNLRTKIEKDPSKPEYIETVFGVGYRFRDPGE